MPEQDATEPDWDSPLTLTLTPALLIHSLMKTATAVHTGWSTCIDDQLVVANLVSMDDAAGNYVRLAEQEFFEDEDPETVWHDWTLEIRVGQILTTGGGKGLRACLRADRAAGTSRIGGGRTNAFAATAAALQSALSTTPALAPAFAMVHI